MLSGKRMQNLNHFTARFLKKSLYQIRAISSQKLISIEIKEKNEYLTRILMNNEKQRNALGLNMIRELQRAIDTIDKKCRVLVIGSASKKIFSSGHNLKGNGSDYNVTK